MLRLQADRGKNHDPARTVSLRLFERDTVLASVKTHAAARLALARQVLTEAARDVPEKRWPGQENGAPAEQKNWRGRTRIRRHLRDICLRRAL